MKLTLVRTYFFKDRCIGYLYLDGDFFCYTLEDHDRRLEEGGEKVPKETAIPRGTYKIKLTMSTRFKQVLPELIAVPQFTGIRIHAGNFPGDTEGCILVGEEYNMEDTTIRKSRIALNELMAKLIAVEDGITIDIL